MQKLRLTLSFYFLFVLSSFAQNFNSKTLLCDSCDKEISLQIESASFIKNNEYFNDFSKGFTGLGFFLKPTLQYYFTKNTKVSAGVFLLKYDGMDYFTQAIPIFSIQQRLTPNLDLILGSIYGTLNHQLEEPLFRFDRYYQNHVENGFQLLYHSTFIKSDLWLNWEKFIFTNSPYQEELVFGNNTRFTVFQSKKFSVHLPFQFLISHIGGQIDASLNPVATLVNGMSGLSLGYVMDDGNSLKFESLYFLYHAMAMPETGINSQPFKNGQALYLKVQYNYKSLSTMIGYWSANKFIAPRGEFLFQSVSDWKEGFSQEKRKLITAKIELKHKLSESIKIVLKADAYYDVMNANLAHSEGLYFIINESFFLKKIKSNRN